MSDWVEGVNAVRRARDCSSGGWWWAWARRTNRGSGWATSAPPVHAHAPSAGDRGAT